MQKCSLTDIVNILTVPRECTEIVVYLLQLQSFINTQKVTVYQVHIDTGGGVDSISLSRTSHNMSTCTQKTELTLTVQNSSQHVLLQTNDGTISCCPSGTALNWPVQEHLCNRWCRSTVHILPAARQHIGWVSVLASWQPLSAPRILAEDVT